MEARVTCVQLRSGKSRLTCSTAMSVQHSGGRVVQYNNWRAIQ